MNDERIQKIWTMLNDVDVLFEDMSVIVDVLNVYLEFNSNSSPIDGVIFIASDLNKKFDELKVKYETVQSNVFELIKNLKSQ